MEAQGSPVQGQPMTVQEAVDLRERLVKGENVSVEELKRAILFLRQDRVTCLQAKTKSAKEPKVTGPKAKINIDDLMSGLV